MQVKLQILQSIFKTQNVLFSFRYRNRVVESDSYNLSRAQKRFAVTQFGTLATPDPCQSMLGRFMSRFKLAAPEDEVTDNPGVNVFFHGDELFATTETDTIRRINPEVKSP